MIYIFKTSVTKKQDILQLTPIIKESIPYSSWSFDLTDCDNILRIETKEAQKEAIIQLLKENGFECEELSD